MFAKPTDQLTHLAGRLAGLSKAGAALRDALPRMTGPAQGLEGRPTWFPDLSKLPGADAAPASMAVPPAVRDMLDRLNGMKPGAGLCGMTSPGTKPAAVAVPEGARVADFVHAGPSGTLGYKLYVPTTYAGQEMPLVVMLHGCTQSPDDFAAGTRMNEVAEERGLLVAYPRQTQSGNAQKCWNWFDAKDQSRDRGEPGLIAGMTREIMRDFAVDPARVFVAGLSAGGAMAAIMAQAYPELYAAAGVHSGLAAGAAIDMVSAFAAMRQGGVPQAPGGRRRPVPTIVFHGDGDRTVHPSNGAHVLTQAGAGAAFASAVTQGRSAGGLSFTRTVQSDAAGRPVLEDWVLHGAGHAWSGGSQAGSYTEPRGPDASREMVGFFLRQAPECTASRSLTAVR